LVFLLLFFQNEETSIDSGVCGNCTRCLPSRTIGRMHYRRCSTTHSTTQYSQLTTHYSLLVSRDEEGGRSRLEIGLFFPSRTRAPCTHTTRTGTFTFPRRHRSKY
jgi:hypothetical protein